MASSNSQQEKWLIKIPYRGKENVYELSKEMSPPLNFESMARYTVLARANNEFSPRSAPFNFAAFKFIVDSNNPQRDEIIKFFRDKLGRTLPSTLSLVVYNHDGKGHDIYMNTEYECPGRIVGPNSRINIKDSSILETMIGEKNPDEVKRVINGINQSDTSIFRLNSKPKQVEKRVVGFGANFDGFNLDLERSLSYLTSSFGYKLVE